MHVQIAKENAAELTLALQGELDKYTIPQLRQHRDSIISASQVSLDCSGLEYIDSFGLSLLLSLTRKRRDAQKDHIKILNTSPKIHRVFELALLDTVFTFVPAGG